MRNARTRVLTFSPRLLIGVAIVVISFLSLPKHACALVDVWIDPGHGAIQYGVSPILGPLVMTGAPA
jgi:hypothetical protein